MLSFSNFGSTRHPLADKVRRATAAREAKGGGPDRGWRNDADTAIVPELVTEDYPFSQVKGDANVLIFPSLEAGNIAYKLMMRMGGAEALGPILMGMAKPVHVLARGAEVEEIVNMAVHRRRPRAGRRAGNSASPNSGPPAAGSVSKCSADLFYGSAAFRPSPRTSTRRRRHPGLGGALP